jgi:hypothetical protein
MIAHFSTFILNLMLDLLHEHIKEFYNSANRTDKSTSIPIGYMR